MPDRGLCRLSPALSSRAWQAEEKQTMLVIRRNGTSACDTLRMNEASKPGVAAGELPR
jgi:hypothetical protein